MSFTFGQQFLSVDRAGMINTEQIHFSCPLDDFEVTSVCTLRHSEPLETSTMSCLLVGKKKFGRNVKVLKLHPKNVGTNITRPNKFLLHL